MKSAPDADHTGSARKNYTECLLPSGANAQSYNTMNDTTEITRPSLTELTRLDFYRRDNWFEVMCEILFKIKTRNTTIKSEIYFGIIHFISCLYCLAVIPQQLEAAGYDSRSTVVSVAACSGIGSIFCGLFANLPFVLAPPTVVSIFLSVFLQQHGDSSAEGDIATIISGVILLIFGWRPIGQFVSRLIPVPIQVGTAVGIGLLTSLAGSTEIDLVVKGNYTILDIGVITFQIGIAIFGVILICVTMYYHVKGSFCLAVIICSLTWWIYDNDFPTSLVAAPHSNTANLSDFRGRNIPLLTVDLVFLYVLYLNGLVTSLSNLAVLTREDSSIPRGRWVFIICGIFTILGGFISAPPILISPESSASIKAGAKTGLSTFVCGVCFIFSLFFSPIFEKVPAAGTSPCLIMIGIILFQNVNRIDWRSVTDAAPAFVVLFYIPFTYSVIQGVVMGYIVYLTITLCTGELRRNFNELAQIYCPWLLKHLPRICLVPPEQALLAGQDSISKPPEDLVYGVRSSGDSKHSVHSVSSAVNSPTDRSTRLSSDVGLSMGIGDRDHAPVVNISTYNSTEFGTGFRTHTYNSQNSKVDDEEKKSVV